MTDDTILTANTPEELTERLTHTIRRLAQGHDTHLLITPDVGAPYLDTSEHVPLHVGDWVTDFWLMKNQPGENVAWVGRDGHRTATIRVAIYEDQGKAIGMLEISGESKKIFPLDI